MSNSITLPLGTEAVYRGMTGRDEDLLVNPKKARSGEAINEVLANCTLSLTLRATADTEEKTITTVQPADVKRLKAPERLALLIAIRQASFGDEMSVELEDPEDNGAKFHVTVDLSTLEQKAAPVDGEGKPLDGPYDLTLSNGLRVAVDYLDGKSEALVAKADPSTALTSAMFYRIKSVEGVHPNGIRAWLLDLPVKLRNELRAKLSELDAGPVTQLTADAPSGAEVRFDIQGQQSFFFPSLA